jgi:NAD(P)-dependent dehydrogenase (short-subunit alcohol dehydrogenase family)
VHAFAEVKTAFGGLDALATCAGIYTTAPFAETTVEIFRCIHDVNVIGTFLCLREAAAMMEAGGRICTVASVAGCAAAGWPAPSPMPPAKARCWR